MRLPFLAIALAAIAVPLAAQPGKPPAADPVLGQRQFLQCQACHRIGANSIGPNLVGIVGARAATRPGFAYSPAMAKSGIVWTPAALDAFLTRPSLKVPGTRMIFAGVANPAARQNLIAYLAKLKAK